MDYINFNLDGTIDGYTTKTVNKFLTNFGTPTMVGFSSIIKLFKRYYIYDRSGHFCCICGQKAHFLIDTIIDFQTNTKCFSCALKCILLAPTKHKL